MNKLCECGCGNAVKMNKYGECNRFLNGHRSGYGVKNQNWGGGTRVRSDGYVYVTIPERGEVLAMPERI